MSLESGRDQADRIPRFWDRYQHLLEAEKVPPMARPWYRRHVEGYIRDRRGEPLAETSRADVEGFLTRLSDGGIEHWRLRQTVDALRIPRDPASCLWCFHPGKSGRSSVRWTARPG